MLQREGYATTEDGVRLFFQCAGSGRRAVLIPNGFALFDHLQPLAKGRTLIFFDQRLRGKSDHVTEPARIDRGIHHNVDDLEAIRRHFGLDTVTVMAHSYMCTALALYATRFADHVERIVLVGPMEPRPGTAYPAHLTGADDTLREALAKIAALAKMRESLDPLDFCRRFWSIILPIYVVNPADASRLKWDRCDLPNELSLMPYWTGTLMPSLAQLNLTTEFLAGVVMPTLVVHGRKDRSAPYGGARDWARLLPDARLLTIEQAGHAPWIERPDEVFAALEAFLDGSWPERAEKVAAGDPR